MFLLSVAYSLLCGLVLGLIFANHSGTALWMRQALLVPFASHHMLFIAVMTWTSMDSDTALCDSALSSIHFVMSVHSPLTPQLVNNVSDGLDSKSSSSFRRASRSRVKAWLTANGSIYGHLHLDPPRLVLVISFTRAMELVTSCCVVKTTCPIAASRA